MKRERHTETETETERQRERDTERHRQRQRDRDRQTDRQTDNTQAGRHRTCVHACLRVYMCVRIEYKIFIVNE